MTDDEKKNLRLVLKGFAHELNTDRFMLMEYLSPVVDGCRAALSVSVEKAVQFHSISDVEIEELIDATEMSFMNLTVCFESEDTEEVISLVFEDGEAFSYEECVEPDLKFIGPERILLEILDSDSKISVVETLGKSIRVEGIDPSIIIEGLGLLCYPPLLKMARSGVDPSSLLSEDADAIILAAASELVTEIVKAWIDTSMEA